MSSRRRRGRPATLAGASSGPAAAIPVPAPAPAPAPALAPAPVAAPELDDADGERCLLAPPLLLQLVLLPRPRPRGDEPRGDAPREPRDEPGSPAATSSSFIALSRETLLIPSLRPGGAPRRRHRAPQAVRARRRSAALSEEVRRAGAASLSVSLSLARARAPWHGTLLPAGDGRPPSRQQPPRALSWLATGARAPALAAAATALALRRPRPPDRARGAAAARALSLCKCSAPPAAGSALRRPQPAAPGSARRSRQPPPRSLSATGPAAVPWRRQRLAAPGTTAFLSQSARQKRPSRSARQSLGGTCGAGPAEQEQQPWRHLQPWQQPWWGRSTAASPW